MIIDNELDVSRLANDLKTASLMQKLGELEVSLGNARLERNPEKITDLEEQIAEIHSEIKPDYAFESPFPSPVREAAFHGLSGEIIRLIEPHSEADPVALLMNLLTAFGNAIGSGSWFKVGADKHPCNLFCALVGDTAKGRKGTSWSPIRALFEDVDPEWVKNCIQTGLSSGEGLIWAVRDERIKREMNKRTSMLEDVVIDEGVNDKRLLIKEGEFALPLKVLSREGNILSEIIRNAWDSGVLQILTKNTPAKSHGAHISIMGHISIRELIRSLKDVETSNGFANRFLWVCVRRSKVLPFGGDFESIDMNTLTNKLRDAVDFAKQAGEIVWADETKPQWASIYPDLSDGKPGIIGAITARAEAQVTRLACVYALIDRSLVIKTAHLNAALAVWGYSTASVRYIFQNVAGTPLANRILEALASHPNGMTRTMINNHLGGNYNSNRITEALNELEGAEFAQSEKMESSGRPVERWFLLKGVTEKTK